MCGLEKIYFLHKWVEWGRLEASDYIIKNVKNIEYNSHLWCYQCILPVYGFIQMSHIILSLNLQIHIYLFSLNHSKIFMLNVQPTLYLLLFSYRYFGKMYYNSLLRKSNVMTHVKSNPIKRWKEIIFQEPLYLFC